MATNTEQQKLAIVGYWMGHDDENKCTKVLIVIYDESDLGNTVVGYGTACIPDANYSKTKPEDENLSKHLNECAWEETQKVLIESFKK